MKSGRTPDRSRVSWVGSSDWRFSWAGNGENHAGIPSRMTPRISLDLVVGRLLAFHDLGWPDRSVWREHMGFKREGCFEDGI